MVPRKLSTNRYNRSRLFVNSSAVYSAYAIMDIIFTSVFVIRLNTVNSSLLWKKKQFVGRVITRLTFFFTVYVIRVLIFTVLNIPVVVVSYINITQYPGSA